MNALLSLFESTLGPDYARMLVLFLFFLPIFFFAYWVVKRGTPIALRPIAGYAALKGLLGKSAEAGQPVHLSLGTAGIGDQFTADTMAGLSVLDYIAERGAISASPPIVTCSNPTALPLAQDLLRRAYARQGYPEEYDPARARFVAPAPNLGTGAAPDGLAYAAGTMRMIEHQKLVANVLIGHFGDEFLLLSETGTHRELIQIGGASDTRVLPFVQATMNYPLIGEEIYAGGAYLSAKPAHLSSLLAQDVLRWLLVGGVAAAVLFKTLGLF